MDGHILHVAKIELRNGDPVFNIEVHQNGLKRQDLQAISGEADLPGFTPNPVNRLFETFEVKHSRAFDSEVKIFEKVAEGLSPNASGVIRLFSERPPCPSCVGVIEQFQRKFPNIRIVISQANDFN